MRYRGLQGTKAVVERQECMLAEGDDDRLVLDRKHCRLRVLRSGLQISDRAALFPLGDGLGIDAVSFGKAPQALLTMLYRSTDRLCRWAAAVKNLSHSASLKFPDKGAPSNPGIKQFRDCKVSGCYALEACSFTYRFLSPESHDSRVAAEERIRPKKHEGTQEGDLFRARLDRLINISKSWCVSVVFRPRP